MKVSQKNVHRPKLVTRVNIQISLTFKRQQVTTLEAHSRELRSTLASLAVPAPRVVPPVHTATRALPTPAMRLLPTTASAGSGDAGRVQITRPAAWGNWYGVAPVGAAGAFFASGVATRPALLAPPPMAWGASVSGGSPAHAAAGRRALAGAVGPTWRPHVVVPTAAADAVGVQARAWVAVAATAAVGTTAPRRGLGAALHRHKHGKLEEWERERVELFVDQVRACAACALNPHPNHPRCIRLVHLT